MLLYPEKSGSVFRFAMLYACRVDVDGGDVCFQFVQNSKLVVQRGSNQSSEQIVSSVVVEIGTLLDLLVGGSVYLFVQG